MQLNSFLASLTARIEPQRSVRNIVIPQMRSPEVVDSFEPAFRKELEGFFEYRAIDMMDHLSVNEYWFLMMAAAALVRGRSKPLRTIDVQDGIFVLRGRIMRDVLGRTVYPVLLAGQPDKLSGEQTEYARREGLLVWGDSFSRQMLVKVNPVFFKNTGEW